MSVSDVWQKIGAGDSMALRMVRALFLAGVVIAFYFLAILPLTWPQQAVCGLLTLLLALALSRSSDSYLVTLTLMLMSLFCTFRYGFWRVTQSIDFFRDPGNHWGILDAFFILCLLAAEFYAFVILCLGYFQTIWPLRRAPVAMPDDEEEWPHIDVLIPTYNEPLDVVRYTALGALNMDWPAEKMHVYILDDGRRKEFEEFAREAGIGYRIRPDNAHAKAGNINTALKTMHSPYVAIFDCDHVPTRSFLQMAMGWFLRDPKLAMLQTPHHFYSPDPFERNLGQFRVIPNEGELFYGIVQDGNDFWNATFFCGSCAVLRREALDEIGGIAVETVTEDAHTSLRMQIRGWGTAYINIPQAAGLATERLSAHVGQRIRWARGMIQILRTDNPLFAPGLKFAQRLCYFNAMMHFLYAVPRLIFLSAPLIFLIFNRTNVAGYWAAILAYALPHLTLSNVTNSRIQGEHRHSFWNEIYETVLSPYILLPTMLALINPKLGKFNVTAKGGVVKRTFFDAKIAQPFLLLLLFNIIGLAVAVPRFLWWDRDRPGTVLMNVVWCLFNIVILGVTTAVAREMRQLRSTVRIALRTPVMVKLADGRMASGETIDMSSGGSGIRLDEPLELSPDTQVGLFFPQPSVDADLPATVVSVEEGIARVRFDDLTIPEQEILTMVLYSRADSWLGWGESRETDDVLRSLGRIFRISMLGLLWTFQSVFLGKDKAGARSEASTAVKATAAILLVILLPCASLLHAQRLPNVAHMNNESSTMVHAGEFHDSFTLEEAGSQQIEMRGIDSRDNIYFTLPQTQVARAARIHLSYTFSPSLLPQLSHIKLLMNGTLFATVQPTPAQNGGTLSLDEQGDFTIPADLLVHNNTLTIEFIGHYVMECEDPANTALWARVHRDSRLFVDGEMLTLADDLKQLPLPFLDPAVIQPLSVPVVFPQAPSMKAIQAAGVVTSYFGMVSEHRAVRFPTHIGTIPQGNVILVSERPENLPAELHLSNVSGATVAMRANPSDPYGKVLVVTGANGDQLLQAAQAVALRTDVLQGAQVTIEGGHLPNRLAADAAPRWAQTDQKISLWNYAEADQLQGDGSAPLNVYFRVPPDVFYGDRPNAVLHLSYRYNSIPIGPISSMQVRVNNAFIASVPLAPGQEASRKMEVDIPVPVVNLRPFSNSLSFEFTFQLQKKGGCQDTTPINMQGSILRDSYLDLTGYSHYTALPNLELFANAGFPFTRYADLGETTVILPLLPTEQEMETFLTLMAHFSRHSGYPALRVSVDGPDAMKDGADTDFLVIGTGDDQPALDKLSNELPVGVHNGQVQVHDTQGIFAPLHRAWWKVRPPDHEESGDLIVNGTLDGILEAVASPFAPHSNRSVVVIHYRNAALFEPMMKTLLDVQQASDISGSVCVYTGGQFQSYRLGDKTYHVGELSIMKRMEMFFMRYPWLAAVLVMGLAFLLAIWMRLWLRVHARSRLRPNE